VALQDYGATGNAFNGRIKGVQISIAEAAESVDRENLLGAAAGRSWRPPGYKHLRQTAFL
jgi:hypothetical protein